MDLEQLDSDVNKITLERICRGLRMGKCKFHLGLLLRSLGLMDLLRAARSLTGGFKPRLPRCVRHGYPEESNGCIKRGSHSI